jgi:glycolate oxidase iron-sulfur subunit
MAASERPQQVDLDHCVHCGLCLNACPTSRELGLEMDSPRGRIYQMVQVANGAPLTASYVEHIDLCLACRGCESACPSGVEYGKLVEAARAQITAEVPRPWAARLVRRFVFGRLLSSRALLTTAGSLLWLYQASGLQKLTRAPGLIRLLGPLANLEALMPAAEAPFFFRHIGKLFPAEGKRRYKVGFLAGCIANVSFARLNEATLRVLQKNGCDVLLPEDQTCCGALHLHAGYGEEARELARRNIDAFLAVGCDAIITNAAGCGSTLKEYHELLRNDPAYAGKARRFTALLKDVNEFLAGIGLNPDMAPVRATVTYQDSCHLAHGQRIRSAPRKLLAAVPGLTFREMPNSDVIATANPCCMLQLAAGARLYGRGQRVMHVVEILDEAYRKR